MNTALPLSKNGWFRLVTPELALDLYSQGIEVFKVYDDDSEALVESIADIEEAILRDIQLGIQIKNKI